MSLFKGVLTTWMEAAVYLRVSTAEQDELNQLPAIERMVQARGSRICRVYRDVASGSKTGRPALEQMMAGARAGEFRQLYVWAVDRLGRRMSHLIQMVEELDRLGVAVVSVQEAWLDTSGPVRPLLLSIFSWVAEQERSRLVERTRAGVAAARLAGKTLGRPVVAVDLDRLARLRAAGHSIASCARAMGLGVGTIHRALQSSDLPESVR